MLLDLRTQIFRPRIVLLCSLAGAGVRISAILVLVQTLYLKYFLWHDFVTSNVGIVLGCALALLVFLVPKSK